MHTQLKYLTHSYAQLTMLQIRSFHTKSYTQFNWNVGIIINFNSEYQDAQNRNTSTSTVEIIYSPSEHRMGQNNCLEEMEVFQLGSKWNYNISL